jgi:hypothetical protein
LSFYKRKLWSIFSEYIRRRDADENGMVKCISCPTIKHWKEVDAGHFRPKSLGLPVYFVEKNVHPQCTYCNHVKEGNAYEYGLALIEKYGKGIIEEIDGMRHTPLKWSCADYEEMIEAYKKKLGALDDLVV